MKPAPPHIAVFGEGENPEPFQAHLRIAELDTLSARHAARARLASALALGVAIGALPFTIAESAAALAVVAAVLLACAVFVLWSRSAAMNAMLAMSETRAGLVPPFKIVEDKSGA